MREIPRNCSHCRKAGWWERLVTCLSRCCRPPLIALILQMTLLPFKSSFRFDALRPREAPISCGAISSLAREARKDWSIAWRCSGFLDGGHSRTGAEPRTRSTPSTSVCSDDSAGQQAFDRAARNSSPRSNSPTQTIQKHLCWAQSKHEPSNPVAKEWKASVFAFYCISAFFSSLVMQERA